MFQSNSIRFQLFSKLSMCGLLICIFSFSSINEAKAQEPFLGEIRAFGFNFAPRGWAKWEGQLLPISQNSALFSLLGTMYGGDGRTTFALPDLRGRVAMGCGNGPGLTNRNIGQKLGQETHTLNVNEIPSHNHALTGEVKLPISADDADSDDPSGTFRAVTGDDLYGSSASPGEFGGAMSNTLQVGNTGGGQAHNNIQPCLVINYCIALQGLYPSRN